MRKIKYLVSALFLLLVLAACGQNSSEETQNSLDKIKDDGVIEVGGTTTGPPFTYHNTETEKMDGVMVELAEKIGEELDVEVNFNDMEFSSLIPSLEAGKINMASAGMAMTDERKEVVDFSVPVYEYGEGLVVQKDNTSINSIDDLEEKKVGVQEGTIYKAGLDDEYPNVDTQTYSSTADMIKELGNGRIDAFFVDYPIAVYMIEENPDFEVEIVEGYEPEWIAEIGVAFSPDQNNEELKEEVNKIINMLEEKGEIDEIFEGL